LAGHDIFKGRALLMDSTPDDYSNFIVACLFHDIGYVRGVLIGDGPDGYVVDSAGHKVKLPRGCSDASLAPHHVERSKLFVLDRLASSEALDGARIAGAIEHTHFPYSSVPDRRDVHEDGALLRAADLIGQLGDPHYLRKANALYREFEEIGLNQKFGYESPVDLVDKYPQFYWARVSPYISDAIRYLNVTANGPLRQRLSRHARAPAAFRSATLISRPWRPGARKAACVTGKPRRQGLCPHSVLAIHKDWHAAIAEREEIPTARSIAVSICWRAGGGRHDVTRVMVRLGSKPFMRRPR
jgi:hypothetical protein